MICIVCMVDPTHMFGIPDNQFLCGLATQSGINERYYLFSLPEFILTIPFKHLFISREEAERLDPRDDRTSSIRTQLTQTLIQRMYSSNMPVDQGKSIETVQSQTQLSQQQSGQESASLSPPATAVVDYSQPAQIHQTHSLEARNVSAVRSVSNSSPSQSQATRETTNSTLPLNPPVSTNPRPLDIQFTNSVPPSPSTIGNFISQALLPQPPLSNDNSTQGQSPDREAGVPPSNQGRSPPKTLLREGSATSSNLPHNIDSITSGLRPHPTTLPLHPHPKSPQAVSPPRSPPLPAMPKQVLDPTEIKQPVPGLAAFTSPVAADMNDLVNEPGKGIRSLVSLVVSYSLNSRYSISFCFTREHNPTQCSENERAYGPLESQ